MVQSIINLGERADKVLNIVKAKFGLKNKSQAMALIIRIYEESFLERELRSEYLEKLMKISKGKHIPFKDINDLRRQIKEDV
jgi:hypothetical protein